MFRKVQFPRSVSHWVLTFPQVFIVIPLLVAFLLSYPSLLTRSAWYETSNSYISRALVIHEQPSFLGYDYSLTKIIIQPNDDSNALSKSFLIDALAAQAKITKNISEEVTIHSPFDVWDNNIERLRNDRSPSYTVNEKLHTMPMYLFQGLLKVNGHVSFCKRLSITLMVPFSNLEQVNRQLENNMKEMRKIREASKFYVFQDKSILPSDNLIFKEDAEMLEVVIAKLNIVDYFIVLLVYFLMFSIFVHVMKETKAVKSRIGISFAVIAQVLLVLYAAKSITCFFFKSSSDNVPWLLIYIPVLFCSISNLMKLTMDKKGSIFVEKVEHVKKKEKQDTTRDFSFADNDFLSCNTASNEYTLRTTSSIIVLVILVLPFSRKVTCFFSSALILNFILQVTYFSAVLSLDHRRLKYNELLLSFSDDSSSSLDVSLDNGVESKRSVWNSIMEALTEFNAWFPKTDLLSTSSTFTVLYMVYLNIRFASVRSSSSIVYKVFFGGLTNFSLHNIPFITVVFDKRFVSNELIRKSKHNSTVNRVLLTNSLFIIKDKINDTSLPGKSYEEVAKLFNWSPLNTYKFDLFYFVEFCVFILLITVSTLLVLQLITRKIDRYNSKLYESFSSELTRKPFNKRKITPPAHDVNSNAFHIKELSVNGHKLDIFSIITSQAPFVVSVGIDHMVLVWSPLSKPMPSPMKIALPSKFWPVTKGVLSNDGTFVAFFNNSGKIVCWSRQTMKFIWAIRLSNKEISTPLEAFFRKRTVPGFMKRKGGPDVTGSGNKKFSTERRSSVISLKSVTSISSKSVLRGGSIDASYENFVSESNDETSLVEFIFIMPCGSINIVDSKGNLKTERLIQPERTIKCCKRLVTPRMNERLVLTDNTGELYISTVINNKWKTRKLLVLRDSFNKGRGLMTPLMLNMERNETIHLPQEKVEEGYTESKDELLLVPFVGMVLRTRNNNAELIDVQSGTMVKKIRLTSYKPGSLRIFHDQPTHCRFCGSASVATLSVAYTSAKNSFIMHTFQLESRTKTSICLRVERDPREIRCLGIEAVVEKKYILSSVDLWDVTENNMVVGIRRKPELIGKERDYMRESTSMAVSLHQSEPDNQVQKRTNKHRCKKKMDSFKIHNVWEGWTMNAYGKVIFHEIPTGMNGLLVNSLGPLAKFGSKSIVVAFGNIMKVFYLGNEEFLLEADRAGVNEENSGLRFVNKRRERLVHKINTNYGEINSA